MGKFNWEFSIFSILAHNNATACSSRLSEIPDFWFTNCLSLQLLPRSDDIVLGVVLLPGKAPGCQLQAQPFVFNNNPAEVSFHVDSFNMCMCMCA